MVIWSIASFDFESVLLKSSSKNFESESLIKIGVKIMFWNFSVTSKMIRVWISRFSSLRIIYHWYWRRLFLSLFDKFSDYWIKASVWRLRSSNRYVILKLNLNRNFDQRAWRWLSSLMIIKYSKFLWFNKTVTGCSVFSSLKR